MKLKLILSRSFHMEPAEFDEANPGNTTDVQTVEITEAFYAEKYEVTRSQ